MKGDNEISSFQGCLWQLGSLNFHFQSVQTSACFSANLSTTISPFSPSPPPPQKKGYCAKAFGRHFFPLIYLFIYILGIKVFGGSFSFKALL